MKKKNLTVIRSPKSRTRRIVTGVKLFGFFGPFLLILGFDFPREIAQIIPGFTVKGILVTGNRSISSETIRNTVGLAAGQNILTIDMEKIKQTVGDLPNIKSVFTQKLFPDIIGVRVVEREPVAVLPGEYPLLVDIEGVPLQFDLSLEKVDMPILTGVRAKPRNEISIERMRAALSILRIIKNEDFPIKLSEINVSNSKNIILHPDQKPISILLGGEKFKERLLKLAFAWNQLETKVKPGAKLDLRFRRQIIMKTETF